MDVAAGRIVLKKLLLLGVSIADSLLLGAGDWPMMGERRVMQEALFYGFSLDRHVPDDHLELCGKLGEGVRKAA